MSHAPLLHVVEQLGKECNYRTLEHKDHRLLNTVAKQPRDRIKLPKSFDVERTLQGRRNRGGGV